MAASLGKNIVKTICNNNRIGNEVKALAVGLVRNTSWRNFACRVTRSVGGGKSVGDQFGNNV